MDSICRFLPPPRTGESLHMVNFVYETRHGELSESQRRSVYSMHLVTEGTAAVTCGGKTESVGPGDVYFLFPAVDCRVVGGAGFRYLYLSFFGIRAGAELERLGIGPANFVFRDMGQLSPFWWECLSLRHEVVDLVSESVLLYSLSRIGQRYLPDAAGSGLAPGAENAKLLKEYADLHFAEPELNLDRLSTVFSYSKKYISALFRRHYGLGFVEYLRTVRIQHACRLLREGDRTVAETAAACGFRDALYFSRVFREETGLSPRDYRVNRISSEDAP